MLSGLIARYPVYMNDKSGPKASGKTLGTQMLVGEAVLPLSAPLKKPLWAVRTARCPANWRDDDELSPTTMIVSGGVCRAPGSCGGPAPSHERYSGYITAAALWPERRLAPD